MVRHDESGWMSLLVHWLNVYNLVHSLMVHWPWWPHLEFAGVDTAERDLSTEPRWSSFQIPTFQHLIHLIAGHILKEHIEYMIRLIPFDPVIALRVLWLDASHSLCVLFAKFGLNFVNIIYFICIFAALRVSLPLRHYMVCFAFWLCSPLLCTLYVPVPCHHGTNPHTSLSSSSSMECVYDIPMELCWGWMEQQYVSVSSYRKGYVLPIDKMTVFTSSLF